MSVKRVWRIEEVGDYSLLLSSAEEPPNKGSVLFPNATDSFVAEYGRYPYNKFLHKFSVIPKEVLHTPEQLVVYFQDKVPNWAKVGMEVVL